MKRPQVRVVARVHEAGSDGLILGQPDHVYVNGEEWPVSMVGVEFRAGSVTEITLTFLGNVEIEAA